MHDKSKLRLAQGSRLIFAITLLSASIYLTFNDLPALGITTHALTVLLLVHTTFNPNTNLLGPITSHTGTDQIHLTIDDGPDPTDTPIILDLLAENNIRATFFLIGKKAKKHPGLVRQIHAAGHHIGNHTQTHPQASIWAAGPWRTYREIKSCQDTLTHITGTPPTQYRAPVGHFNLFTHPVLKHLNLTLTGWSARGYDAGNLPLENILAKLKATTKPGTIILIHESTPYTEKILTTLLQHTKTHNLTLTPLNHTQSLSTT